MEPQVIFHLTGTNRFASLTYAHQGATRLWDFHWVQEHGAHIFEGRLLSIKEANDLAEEIFGYADECFFRPSVRIVDPVPALVPAPAEPKINDEIAESKARASRHAVAYARENGVDLSVIEGTGKGGLITKGDVVLFLEGTNQPKAEAVENLSLNDLKG